MKPSTKPWSIIDLIKWGTAHFMEKGITNSRREMEWLLCNVLDFERIDLYLNFDYLLKSRELHQLRSMVKRRSSGEPFQHIIGKATFYGRDFIVNKSVLIPRPETEILIDRLKSNGKVSSLLDVGTGSGCIAITCALEKLSKKIDGTDISPEALEIAQENLQFHKLSEIQLACHDFLKKGFNSRYDVVISNPPYISVYEVENLQNEVKNFDPVHALTDFADGYSFYRRFYEMFNTLVNPDGYLLLEIGGNNYKEHVKNIFSRGGLNITFFKDLQGDDRVAEVRK